MQMVADVTFNSYAKACPIGTIYSAGCNRHSFAPYVCFEQAENYMQSPCRVLRSGLSSTHNLQ